MIEFGSGHPSDSNQQHPPAKQNKRSNPAPNSEQSQPSSSRTGKTTITRAAVADTVANILATPTRNAQAVENQTASKTSTPTRSALLKTGENVSDQKLDNTVRPKTLSDYVGQQHLKNNLQISLDAAKNRQEALDHILLYGPPGLGKTTLALVIAQEMNAPVHITSAPALERPRDVLGILMALKPGAVLFIDEIHRLNKVTEEILYPAMEDYRLDRTIGKGESTKILSVPIPRFTLIGATTKAGSISGPLRDRFGMIYRLNFYTTQELMNIVRRSAGILNISITEAGAHAIAKRSRGTPRIANRLLRRVRDYLEVKRTDQTEINETVAEEALDLFNVDHLGLDPTDRQMLTLMIEHFSGGPVGLDTLASSLGEDPRTIEDVYEPFLLQSGLIHRTPRGRVVSPKAYQHLNYSSHMIPEHLKATQTQLLTDFS